LCRNEESCVVHGPSETIVGVLGGGQLGRMLCQAASEMAIKVIVLDPQENCPASSLAYQHMVGSFDDSTTVQEFAKRFMFFLFVIHVTLNYVCVAYSK
jgi:phosphoribosylaminoimidazole carboxylase